MEKPVKRINTIPTNIDTAKAMNNLEQNKIIHKQDRKKKVYKNITPQDLKY